MKHFKKFAATMAAFILAAGSLSAFDYGLELSNAGGIKKQDEIVASGMGDTKPLAPNDTPDGRTKNRRVEIVIMDEEASE